MSFSLLKSDFQEIEKKAQTDLAALGGKRIFVTGATGFFGKWILGAIAHHNTSQGGKIQVTALSRNPEQFLENFPELRCDEVVFIRGDIRDFEFPKEKFDYVLHGATEASEKLNREAPFVMLDTVIDGTKRVLQFAAQCGAKRILLTSSGAVYGKQPNDLSNVSEDYLGAPDCLSPLSAYGEGKRTSELLGAIHHQATGQEVLIARCFAFVGPYLPLDTHFAIGNFMGDCLADRDIVIKGDGTPLRSYLYTADLVVWLLKVLVGGKNLRAYNVGSDQALSIRQTADIVAKVWNSMQTKKQIQIKVLGRSTGAPPLAYVPSVERAKAELKLEPSVSVEEAIRRTLQFHLQGS